MRTTGQVEKQTTTVSNQSALAVNPMQLLVQKAAARPFQLAGEEKLLQPKFNPLQLLANKKNAPVQKKENNTGLPGQLKEGIESISGYAMDDVRVHYNSDKPSQLQAHAYAQGTDIHVAPGQEQHLPHEAWHVVQQKQGRVQPTMQAKGISINDDKGLENEADVMGSKALQLRKAPSASQTVVQRVIVAPTIEEIDVNTAIGIYQMLRNGVDTTVALYSLLEAKAVDLSKESQILFKGHGFADGEYAIEGGKSGAEIAAAIAAVNGGKASLIGLDFCNSAGIARALAVTLKDTGFTGEVRGNKTSSVTQDNGNNYAKIAQKTPEQVLEYQTIIARLTGDLAANKAKADQLNEALKKALVGQKDIKEIAKLFSTYGAAMYAELKIVYDQLYKHNLGVIDKYGKAFVFIP
jgi:hypothetical protein